MDNNQLNHFASPCRLCLSEDNFQIPIFGESAREKQVFLKIQYCLPLIKVTEDDILPKHICYKCLSTLDSTYAFWKQCSGSESVLRRRFSVPNHRHFKRTPYKRLGHQIKGALEYHSSIHYGLELSPCKAIPQAAYMALSSEESEDDWDSFNFLKNNKMFNTTHHSVFPMNNVRHTKDIMPQILNGGRSRTLPQWVRSNPTIDDDNMDTSPDLLEIIEQESLPFIMENVEKNFVEGMEKNIDVETPSNSNRAQTSNLVEEKKFVSEFWKQNSSHSSAIKKQGSADKPYKEIQSRSQDNISQRSFDFDAVVNNTLLYNNLNIPESWHSDLLKLKNRNDSTKMDVTGQPTSQNTQIQENTSCTSSSVLTDQHPNIWHSDKNKRQTRSSFNKMDYTLQSSLANTGNKENTFFSSAMQNLKSKPMQSHREDDHSEASVNNDLSHLTLNVGDNNECNEFSRTRNLLKRFRSLRSNSKQ